MIVVLCSKRRWFDQNEDDQIILTMHKQGIAASHVWDSWPNGLCIERMIWSKSVWSDRNEDDLITMIMIRSQGVSLCPFSPCRHAAIYSSLARFVTCVVDSRVLNWTVLILLIFAIYSACFMTVVGGLPDIGNKWNFCHWKFYSQTSLSMSSNFISTRPIMKRKRSTNPSWLGSDLPQS